MGYPCHLDVKEILHRWHSHLKYLKMSILSVSDRICILNWRSVLRNWRSVFCLERFKNCLAKMDAWGDHFSCYTDCIRQDVRMKLPSDRVVYDSWRNVDNTKITPFLSHLSLVSLSPLWIMSDLDM